MISTEECHVCGKYQAKYGIREKEFARLSDGLDICIGCLVEGYEKYASEYKDLLLRSAYMIAQLEKRIKNGTSSND